MIILTLYARHCKFVLKQVDDQLRPTAEMNENVFTRKWNVGLDGLKRRIKNGILDSFCDPAKSVMKIIELKIIIKIVLR